MDDISKDPRFAHVPKDPKFRRIPKSERKVKIDKRFQSMFKDKKFKVSYTIDKRGRPMQKSSSEDLEKYYELSSESEEDDSESESQEPQTKPTSSKKSSKKSSKSRKPKTPEKVSPDSDSEATPDDSESIPDDSKSTVEDEQQLNLKRKNESTKLHVEIKNKLKDLSVDYARGEGALMSDSSSEESSEESEDEGIDHMWGEMDREAGSTEEATSRFAACNMDWDRIRAVDLMVLFSSFLPPGGLILSVTIYPSDFGVQRLREEELNGPMELDGGKESDEEGDGEEDEEGNDFRRERLRQYQLNRLKYFYAVVVCDSPQTANKIYSECDGHEYETTATKIDLRFIPEDMEFEQEAKETCNSVPDAAKYEPRQFTTTALQQVKVECTWDETKLDRLEITKKINSGKIDDIDENDIKTYLASGSSDEEDEEDLDSKVKTADSELDTRDPLEKYKFLLKSIEQQEEEKKKKDGDLEFMWGLGAQDKAEKLVQKKLKESAQLTPFEQFLEKRKEKKKAKREEKRNVKEAGESASDSEDSIPSDVDMNDSYFAEEIKKTKSEGKKGSKKKSRAKSPEGSDGESQRAAELELLLHDQEDDEKHHFDMKKIEETELLTKSKKKRLSKKKKDMTARAAEDEFQVNVEDPRFNALFTSHHFNIDPADSHYRKTKGTEALVKEKLKRRADGDTQEETPSKTSKSRKIDGMTPDLAALIKNVKRNTKNVLRPIK